MWRGEAYSYSADIWALGCILYELCALEPMFWAPDEARARDLVLRGRIELLPRRYSLDLGTLLLEMMHADPAQRITADELLRLPQASERASE
jgi:NIMA (never in mitosis gene a)-related kinase